MTESSGNERAAASGQGKVVSAEAAASLIGDGDTVFVAGSGSGHGVPERMLKAIAERFSQTARPRDLTVMSVVGIGDRNGGSGGLDRLSQPGLLRRVISGGFGACPELARRAIANEIETYTLPQGVLSHLCRESAGGRSGLITKVGLNTFVDPRLQGGLQGGRPSETLVELIQAGGEEFLRFKAIPIDVALIRATTADERGNLSTEEEAYAGEILSAAMAARRAGGLVVAQVKRLAAADSLRGRDVRVPASLVDYIVVDEEQRQTYRTLMNPAYAGTIRQPEASVAPLPFDTRKVIARRAALELFPHAIVNLGFGVSNGIANVAAEEQVYRYVTLTVEQGIVGGIPASGSDAGTGVNYDAMIEQAYQFDFYDGGGLDMAFLSFAEVDAEGNVNVSRYGAAVNGPGGFINISQGTRKVVFAGNLTAGGSSVELEAGKLKIVREGRSRKWVPKVEQITFSGRRAVERGQDIMYVTERAVFRLEPDGITLVEIAPGIDLDRDVLAQIGFPIKVSSALRTMDARIFDVGLMGLREDSAWADLRAAPRTKRNQGTCA
ncbi:MAG: acyl CoA:acetate/3-ketoacid CoA transferase [Lautropia sp.]